MAARAIRQGLVLLAASWCTASGQAADCNANGVEDALDLLAGELTFPAPPSLAAPPEQTILIAVDWDGDGAQDLFTASQYYNGDAAVFLARGDGSFRSPIHFKLSRRTAVLALSDLDLDGRLDLLSCEFEVESSPASLRVRRGQADATLGPSESYPGGYGPTALLPADLDLDGLVDVVVSANGLGPHPQHLERGIFTYRNQGNGQLARHWEFPVAVDSRAIYARLCQLDDDPHIDLAIESQVQVLGLRGRGDGTFLEPATLLQGQDLNPLGLGDLNGDGRQDLVTVEEECADRSLKVLLSAGAAGFELTSYTFGLCETYDALFVADLDRDDDLDILVPAPVRYGEHSVLLNDGTGSLSAPVGFGGSYQNLGTTHLGDLNGDLAPDLLWVDAFGVCVHLNDGHGAFPGRECQAVSSEPYSPVALADLDRDADLDVAFLGSNAVQLLLNDGKATFAGAPRRYLMDPPLATLTTVDVDGDARQDLVGMPADYIAPAVFLSDASGELHPWGAAPGSQGGFPGMLAAADLEGTGRSDLVVADHGSDDNESYGLWIYPNRGDALGPPRSSHQDLRVSFLDSADLEGDGDLDLVFAAGRIHVLWNDGRGSLTVETAIETAGEARRFAIIDGDRQGGLDILAATTEGVSLALQGGPAGFRAAVSLLSDATVAEVTAGDWDGDGIADAAATLPLSVAFLRLDGSGRIASHADVPLASGPIALSRADIDVDGDPDVVAWIHLDAGPGQPISDAVSVLLNGSGRFRLSQSLSAGSVGSIADLDGDGAPDLVSTDEQGITIRIGHGDGTFPPELHRIGAGYSPVASDWNEDGLADLAFLSGGAVTLSLDETLVPTSRDRDRDGVPDECAGRHFRRGDGTADGRLEITDAVILLSYLFLGRQAPPCLDAADADDDGLLGLTDAVLVLRILFLGGGGVPACAPDALGDGLTCDAYSGC